MTDLPSGNEFEPYSNLERAFERARLWLGAILAPVLFCAILWAPLEPTLSPQAHRLAAIMAAVIVLWISEALPMPVTALLGAAACVAMQVVPPASLSKGETTAKVVFAPFADPLMFLFIGSFILSRAIFLHRLDQRLAYGVLSLNWVGARPSRILFAFGAVTAFVSAWISNTATTAMMYTIGLSILAFLFNQEHAAANPINRRYATGLMLMTSFAASIGGLATPIGTPPNIIGLGKIREALPGVEIPFFEWMMIGVPIVICLFVFLYAYLNWLCPSGAKTIAGSQAMIADERARLGSWTAGQRSTVIAFAVTVALWIFPGIVALGWGEDSQFYKLIRTQLPESVAAVVGAALLFILPGEKGHRAINWREAVDIDWGIVLLYGGGVALGDLAEKTGLAKAIALGIKDSLLLDRLSPDALTLALLAVATVVATITSEFTSNTASATIVVPMVIAIAQQSGADPLEPALGATFGASLGFMLPVSTPCNAIVYGSGYIPLGRMIRYGALLDVVGIVVIIILVRLIGTAIR